MNGIGCVFVYGDLFGSEQSGVFRERHDKRDSRCMRSIWQDLDGDGKLK